MSTHDFQADYRDENERLRRLNADMLEALKWIALQGENDDLESLDAIIERALAAIAKAEGR